MFAYALEISFAWFIFYLIYVLFLQKEQFFSFNRGYLLITLSLGLLLPFIQIQTTSDYVVNLPIWLDEVTVGVAPTPLAAEQHWSWFTLIPWLYGLGVAIQSIKLFVGLRKIKQLYKDASVQIQDGYYLVQTNDLHSPFSFGNCLFMSNKITTTPREKQYILKHEAAHIHQGHAVDLFLIEIVGIIFWFNPLVWLYRNAIRDQHEYLADKAVLNDASIKEYGKLLIEQSIPGIKIGLVNHLIYSQLKKRIHMMTTQKQPMKGAFLKGSLSLSAFLLVFIMISCQKEMNQLAALTTEQPPAESSKLEYLSIVEEMPRFPGCEDITGSSQDKKACADQKFLKFIYEHVKYPESGIEQGIEGMTVANFVVNTEGKLINPKILRSIGKDFDAEVLRIIDLMNEQLTWTPGKEKGKLVNVNYNIPIRFKLDKDNQ